MLQVVDGLPVYVVDFETMPELPITGRFPEEARYAEALTDAILKGIITEPGKYGIHAEPETSRYEIFKINE